MSQPPDYKPQGDEEEELVGLLDPDAHQQQQHSYPPSAAPGSSTETSRLVIYHLRPKWPLSKELESQDAVSIIGKDRAESVNLVLNAFPELRKYDKDRINFLMPSDPISNINWSTTYARITDISWAGLQTDLIRVDLADLPGDALRRKHHSILRALLIIGGAMAFPIVVMGFIFLLISIAGLLS